ncbi:hypothetical protein [Actinorugispora endophytica]|nr:hypothetical protein [Actinorugispora endophytica]
MEQWDLAAGEVAGPAGVVVATPPRTAWDRARCLPRLEAVAASDRVPRH